MPKARSALKIALFLLLAGVLLMSLALAQETWQDDAHPYDKARRAVERGDALPITEVIQRLRSEVQGEIMTVEYEFEFQHWVYEFKVLDPQGRLKRVHIDAGTGEMIDEGQD